MMMRTSARNHHGQVKEAEIARTIRHSVGSVGLEDVEAGMKMMMMSVGTKLYKSEM